MKPLALILFSITAFAAKVAVNNPAPAEIFREAVRNYQKDKLAMLKYDYTTTDDNKNKGIEVSSITTVAGTPYERLVSKNGEPLGPDAKKKEQEKFEKVRTERENESKSERLKRLRKYKEDIRFLEEAPEAFDFKMLREEELQGRPAYVIECNPKPGFEPRDIQSKMFTKIQAIAWIDKKDLRIVRATATVIDTVSVGWVMARVAKGSQMALEQMKLADGSWVLKSVGIDGSAKILLVDNKKWNERVTYSDFKLAPTQVARDVAK